MEFSVDGKSWRENRQLFSRLKGLCYYKFIYTETQYQCSAFITQSAIKRHVYAALSGFFMGFHRHCPQRIIPFSHWSNNGAELNLIQLTL